MSAASRLAEPFFRFVVLGACLFALHALWPRDGEAPILVTEEVASSLAEEREALLKRPLTAEEREGLVAAWVDEEVLVREAYRLGLDESDGVIRSRLVEKMRSLLGEEPPEPTRAELEELLRSEPGRFEIPGTTSFEHVYFAQNVEGTALDRLREGADFESLGDEFWLGPTIRQISEKEVSRTFGPDFARELQGLAVDVWCGPIRSSRGAHFVRVLERRKPRPAAFDEVSWLVREDWLRRKREASIEEKLFALRSRYRIRTSESR